jgi:hypothetical protein
VTTAHDLYELARLADKLDAEAVARLMKQSQHLRPLLRRLAMLGQQVAAVGRPPTVLDLRSRPGCIEYIAYLLRLDTLCRLPRAKLRRLALTRSTERPEGRA